MYAIESGVESSGGRGSKHSPARFTTITKFETRSLSRHAPNFMADDSRFPLNPTASHDDDDSDENGTKLDADRKKYNPLKDLKNLKRVEERIVTIEWRRQRASKVIEALLKIDKQMISGVLPRRHQKQE